jgi:hypothetical protein
VTHIERSAVHTSAIFYSLLRKKLNNISYTEISALHDNKNKYDRTNKIMNGKIRTTSV